MGISNIFKRKDRASYYCKVDGKFVKLHGNQEKAREKWRQLVAEYDDSPIDAPPTRDLLKRYFEWLKVNRAESTCVRREPVLKKFSREYGNLKASAIRPHHVTKWVDHHEQQVANNDGRWNAGSASGCGPSNMSVHHIA